MLCLALVFFGLKYVQPLSFLSVKPNSLCSFRYAIHLWDIHHEGVWENRTSYVYHAELIFELSALSVDFIHHLHMLVRPLSIRSFVHSSDRASWSNASCLYSHRSGAIFCSAWPAWWFQCSCVTSSTSFKNEFAVTRITCVWYKAWKPSKDWIQYCWIVWFL